MPDTSFGETAGGADYSVDKIGAFPMELKGNSAEGNVYEPAMKGYGAKAVLTRDSFAYEGKNTEHTNPPGAFLDGGNKYNSVPAGSAGHSNEASTGLE